jgi:hypothetical protein
MNITCWKTKKNAEIIELVRNIKNDKYILKYKNIQEYDVLEKYVYDIVNYQLKEKYDTFDIENYFIEFFVFNNNETVFEYENVCLSIILFLNKSNQLIITDIDIESYKYKDYDNENSIIFLNPDEFNYIVYDCSKFHKISNIIDDINDDELIKPLYLKINVYDKKPNKCIYYNNEEINKKINEEYFDSIIINDRIDKTIYDTTNLICYILYDENTTNFERVEIDELKNILYANKSLFLNNINIKYKENANIDYLMHKYGLIAEDIIPFFNEKIEMTKTNRFANIKIVQNALPLEICYWIINESEKNTWSESSYKNYDLFISIEKIPSVLNFILFISHSWISHIQNVYNFDFNINITDIFVSKCSNKKNNKPTNTNNNNFLTFEIQLNSIKDFIDGYIDFENENEGINLKQGDMIVYNEKKKRKPYNITFGEKYILVLMTEIK